MNTLDFLGNDISRLVPRDVLEFRLAAVLWIAVTLGIPVDALHRAQDTIRRIDALLIANRQRRDHCLLAGLEHLSTRLDFPRLALFCRGYLIVMQRPDA